MVDWSMLAIHEINDPTGVATIHELMDLYGHYLFHANVPHPAYPIQVNASRPCLRKRA